MKFVITVIIVVGLSLGAWQIYQYWQTFAPKQAASAQAAPPPDIPGDQLPGMAPSLQGALAQARQRGAEGLHDFLQTYGNTISDPRRASIELDYVILLAQTSPGDARKEFAKVKSRIGPDSPVYNRVKQLEKTYD